MISQTDTAPETIAALPEWAARTYGGRTAMRFKHGDRWWELSYADLAEAVRTTALGLVAVGVRPGDRVAILAETRPEWTVCDLAIAAVGAVCVPVYPTNSAQECEWVLGDSGTRVVIVEDASQLAKVTQVRGRLPQLELAVVFDPVDAAGALPLDDLRARGAALDPAMPVRRARRVRPDDVSTIVYTSGTTGPPKGCVLSHGNWRSVLDAVCPRLPTQPDDVVYLYLPLAHLFARMVQIATFELGATLVYFGGDIRQVVTELAEVRPTQLPSVPRLFEKIYSQVTAMVEASPPDVKDRFEPAVRLGADVRRRRECGEPISIDDQRRFDEADRQLFSQVRGILGGQVRQALTGAAPISPTILEFFYACGVPVYEAYGMTEATALITANLPGAVRFGTVGRPLPGVEVRIAADGEVLARSGGVFQRYHGNEPATRETVRDGWLHTGDLGAFDDDGFLCITGRKKDIIITAGGKNLTPANIENDLRQHRLISQAVMVGDRRPYPVALITLDPEESVPWARERGLPADLATLAAHPVVRELVQGVIDAANVKYAPPERIRDFAVLDHDLTIDSGALTPTLKVRRAVVAERYAEVIDRLF